MCTCACMHICLCIMHLVPAEIRRGCQILWTGVIDDCEPLYGCWELKPDSLEYI